MGVSDNIDTTYRFLKKKTDVELDSVETTDSVAFVLRVTAESKSLYVRDTIKVALFTNTGDTIRLKAVETDVYSSEFEATSAFYFVDGEKDLKSKRLDAVFNYKSTSNRVKIYAEVEGDESALSFRNSLIVYSNYAAADYAEIYDSDKDGRADSVRIHFIDRLSENILSIDTVFWNAAGKTWKKASKSKMHLSEDSRWVATNLAVRQVLSPWKMWWKRFLVKSTTNTMWKKKWSVSSTTTPMSSRPAWR